MTQKKIFLLVGGIAVVAVALHVARQVPDEEVMLSAANERMLDIGTAMQKRGDQSGTSELQELKQVLGL